MKTKTVNSNAYNYLLTLIGDAKVLDLYVWGKWLKAELDSGINFSVKNTNTD